MVEGKGENMELGITGWCQINPPKAVSLILKADDRRNGPRIVNKAVNTVTKQKGYNVNLFIS